jgi:hypothetical protein
MVLVLAERAEHKITTQDIREALLRELPRASVKDAVHRVSQQLGAPRKSVYEIALQVKNDA